MSTSIRIRVTDKGGSYVTSTVRGIRASSTHSADVAAEKFGDKLFGPGKFRIATRVGLSAGVVQYDLAEVNHG